MKPHWLTPWNKHCNYWVTGGWLCCYFIITVGALIVATSQGGCHAQQIEKKSHPEKKIQRRSNFVGLLKNIFFVNGGTMGWFYAKNAPFLNPKMLTSKGYDTVHPNEVIWTSHLFFLIFSDWTNHFAWFKKLLNYDCICLTWC